MKLLVNPAYRHLQSYIETLPEIFEQEGTTVYKSRNLIKTFITPDGLHVNVKRYHKPRFLNLLAYSLGLRTPKGRRAFDYPTILLGKGINTPEPIAYIEQRQCGLLGYSYFISIQSDYPHLMYEMGEASPQLYERMAPAFAHYTAHMHNMGIMHPDYSPGNILWKEDENGEFHFSIIDINRMYFGEVDMEKGCANLKRIWGNKDFFQLLARYYAHERGFDPSETIEKVMKHRTRFWTRYIKKHGKPYPIEL